MSANHDECQRLLLNANLEIRRLEHALCDATLLAPPREAPKPPAPALTPRQTEVLARLVAGDTGEQMARHLYMGRTTVRTHLAGLYKRLGVHNGAGAVMAAVRVGLIPV